LMLRGGAGRGHLGSYRFSAAHNSNPGVSRADSWWFGARSRGACGRGVFGL